VNLFKTLTEEEQAEFRVWARENYKRGEPISGVWHPVVQAECVRMNAEGGGAEIGEDIPLLLSENEGRFLVGISRGRPIPRFQTPPELAELERKGLVKLDHSGYGSARLTDAGRKALEVLVGSDGAIGGYGGRAPTG
jgi:hypothetical protein